MKPKDKILLTAPYREFDKLIEKLEVLSKKYPGKYQAHEEHIKADPKYINEHTVTIIIDGNFIQYCFMPKQNAPFELLSDVRLMSSLRLLGNELRGIPLLISEIKYVKNIYDEYENRGHNNKESEIESIADILGYEHLVDWETIQHAKENTNDYGVRELYDEGDIVNNNDNNNNNNSTNNTDDIKTESRNEWSSGYIY